MRAPAARCSGPSSTTASPTLEFVIAPVVLPVSSKMSPASCARRSTSRAARPGTRGRARWTSRLPRASRRAGPVRLRPLLDLAEVLTHLRRVRHQLAAQPRQRRRLGSSVNSSVICCCARSTRCTEPRQRRVLVVERELAHHFADPLLQRIAELAVAALQLLDEAREGAFAVVERELAEDRLALPAERFVYELRDAGDDASLLFGSSVRSSALSAPTWRASVCESAESEPST